MTMASAIHAAMSGLKAASRATDIVSSNIANAMTPGHARREVELASSGDTGGVRVAAIVRHADPVLIQNRRVADAALSASEVTDRFASEVSNRLAQTEGNRSLISALAEFDAALVLAASSPESRARLDDAVAKASTLATTVSEASKSFNEVRSQADRAIAVDVDRLNTLLVQVRDLNDRIVTTSVSGVDVSAMIDRRQGLIDQVNAIVPVREIPRDHGNVALYSLGGAILLDGAAARVSFVPVNSVTPAMTLANGALSGLQINGRDLPMSDGANPLRGGALAAHFTVRDDRAVAAQRELDALARDLIGRFASPSVDPTLNPGQSGLFVATGVASDGPGVSERLAINPRLDPAAGGQGWRLRDGLNAATPGAAGNADMLRSMATALAEARTLESDRLGGVAMTAAGAIASLADWAALQGDLAAQRTNFARTTQDQALQAELGLGVDTDTELANLMTLEQAYAANARVLQTLDDMFDLLLRLR